MSGQSQETGDANSNKRPPSSPLDNNELKKLCDRESTTGNGASPVGVCRGGAGGRGPGGPGGGSGGRGPGSGSGSGKYDLSDETIARIVELTSQRVRADIAEELSRVKGEVVRLRAAVENKDKELEDLRKTLEDVRDSNDDLRVRLAATEDRADEAELYSRRNCIRIHNLPETNDESTDNIIVKLGEAIGADIFSDNIDRSHRVGRKWVAGEGRAEYHRPIICKFTSHKYKLCMMTKKKNLKTINSNQLFGTDKIFINEDLTKKRAMFAKEVRDMKKKGIFADTWTKDGVVFVKTNSGSIKRITSLANFDRRDYV